MLKNNLAVLRTQAGYNQRQFGKRVGVSRQTISSIERGDYNPSISLALRIAAEFGLPVEKVFYIEGGMDMCYCERCKMICSDAVCPACGSKMLREPKENDPVFLTRKDYFESGILESILNEKNIPFEKLGVMGQGMAMKVGIAFEHFNFYVPYGAYKKCSEVLDEVFSGEPNEDEALNDND